MKNQNFPHFSEVYRRELLAGMRATPEKYGLGSPQWTMDPSSKIKNVAEFRANTTFENIVKNNYTVNHINLDGDSWKRTAKALGIKKTYKAFNEFIA